MPRYSASATRAGINTANSAYFQLRNTVTTQRLYVVEIGIGIATAPTTAPVLYVSRSSAVGTSTATLAGQPNDPGETSAVGTFDSTWSSAPTFSTTNFLRMGGLAVTAGGYLIWTFYDAPIVVPASTSQGLVFANSAASGSTVGSFSAYCTWDE
jgi:hypothetical protein